MSEQVFWCFSIQIQKKAKLIKLEIKFGCIFKFITCHNKMHEYFTIHFTKICKCWVKYSILTRRDLFNIYTMGHNNTTWANTRHVCWTNIWIKSKDQNMHRLSRNSLCFNDCMMICILLQIMKLNEMVAPTVMPLCLTRMMVITNYETSNFRL